jgi:ribosomal protein S27AE
MKIERTFRYGGKKDMTENPCPMCGAGPACWKSPPDNIWCIYRGGEPHNDTRRWFCDQCGFQIQEYIGHGRREG